MSSFKYFTRPVLSLSLIGATLVGLGLGLGAGKAQAKDKAERKFAVVAQGRMGAGQQSPTPQEGRLESRLVGLSSDWGLVGGLDLAVLWRTAGKGWLKDLRGSLDYESSMRLKLKESDLAGRSVSKPLRWQRLSVGVSPRFSKALGPGRLGLMPTLGYRLRTLFSTVPSALINHGRHGAYMQAGVAYGLAKGRLEVRVAPTAEVLFADAALKRQAEGDLRVAVGGVAELAFWIAGPWRVTARWDQMHAVVGDTAFTSKVATLGFGFDPAGWTK